MNLNASFSSDEEAASVSSNDDELLYDDENLYPPLRQHLYPYLGVIGAVHRKGLAHTLTDEVHPFFNICHESKGVHQSESDLGDTMFCHAYWMTCMQFDLLHHFLEANIYPKESWPKWPHHTGDGAECSTSLFCWQ